MTHGHGHGVGNDYRSGGGLGGGGQRGENWDNCNRITMKKGKRRKKLFLSLSVLLPCTYHYPHAVYFITLGYLLFLFPQEYKPMRAEVSVCFMITPNF